jgi:hypothetical protein
MRANICILPSSERCALCDREGRVIFTLKECCACAFELEPFEANCVKMRLFAGNANVQVVLLLRLDGHSLLVHLRADLFRGLRDSGRAAAQSQQGRLPALRDAARPQRQRVQPAGPPEGVFPARFRPIPHENAGQGASLCVPSMHTPTPKNAKRNGQ